MKRALWTIDQMFGRKLAWHTERHLADLASAPVRATRERTMSLLHSLETRGDGPRVLLGQTPWHKPVQVPLAYLVNAHSIMTGATGSGKTMAALLIIDAILRSPESDIAFAVLDPKGELFTRTLFLVARRLEELPPRQAEALVRRIVIVDLASQDPLTSYNIASPWAGSDLDFFADSRVDTFRELLPSGDGISLRGSAIVKHVLKLLAEHSLPFTYVDRVLSSESFRNKLLARQTSADLAAYFRLHFPSEGRAAIAAVRARLSSTFLSSQSLKLALSGPDAPDFRRLQDEGKIVLINCAGPNISRTTARTLQALFLSDIRQAVFCRTNRAPYLWVCDEAQNFFRTRQLRENMVELLTMSRSFGSFFLYLTQNLSTAVQDGEMLETLHTNIRWSLSMRGSSRDGAFLKPAFPITGRRQKPRMNPYAPPEFYSLAEERGLLLEELAHLPDQIGWLWLKSLTGEAMKIKTTTLELPEGEQFEDAVGRIRADARIGHRVSRATYLAEMGRRDAENVADEETGPVEPLKKSYQAAQDLVR